MTESFEVRASRKATLEPEARPFFEISERELKATRELSEKNFIVRITCIYIFHRRKYT